VSRARADKTSGFLQNPGSFAEQLQVYVAGGESQVQFPFLPKSTEVVINNLIGESEYRLFPENTQSVSRQVAFSLCCLYCSMLYKIFKYLIKQRLGHIH